MYVDSKLIAGEKRALDACYVYIYLRYCCPDQLTTSDLQRN